MEFKLKDTLKILAFLLPFFAISQLQALPNTQNIQRKEEKSLITTPLSGRVYDAPNQSAKGMPVEIKQKRAGAIISTTDTIVDQYNEWSKDVNWSINSDDTLEVTVTDTVINPHQSRSTFVIGNTTGWFSTLYLNSGATQVKEVRNSPTDSVYAKLSRALFPESTLYQKFWVSAGGSPRTYSLAFNTGLVDSFKTVTIEARSFNGTHFVSVSGLQCENSHGDAYVLAESISMTPTPNAFSDVGITRTETLPGIIYTGTSDTLRHINVTLKNNSDLERRTGSITMTRTRAGSSPVTQSLPFSVEPKNFDSDTTRVNFPDWNIATSDTGLNVITYVITPTDSNPHNDTIIKSTLVVNKPINDASAIKISAPDSVAIGDSAKPKAWFKNKGNQSITNLPVFFEIASSTPYLDTATLSSLAPRESSEVTFKWFVPVIGDTGTKNMVAYTSLPGDSNPSNDTARATTTIYKIPQQPGWQRLEDIITNVVGKGVKDGGSLVAVTKDSIFAFRGYKSNEFCKYIVSQDTWIKLDSDSMLYGPKETDTTKINKKKIGKGASLAFDGDHIIYATKGNNTKELWKYDINTGMWQFLTFAPTEKGLKGGTSIVFHNGKLYMVAGGQKKETDNFFCYNISTGGWCQAGTDRVPNNPLNIKVPKDGSCLTVLNNKIYLAKGGAKENEFYEFDPSSGLHGTWNSYPGDTVPKIHPMTGNKKNKVKDGAAMASTNPTGEGKIYLTFGGGFQAFESYTLTGGWFAEETIPRTIESGKKSVVKTGGALAFINDWVYLLKGNKLKEFWGFGPIENPK